MYSTIGLTVGSALAFLLGRWLEVHFVARIVRPETLKRFDFLMERQGALVAFFLFVIPGFPKDYLCFILGLSQMPLRLFLVLSTVGRLPGTLMLTLQGAKVYQGDYLFSAILIGLCLLLGLSPLLLPGNPVLLAGTLGPRRGEKNSICGGGGQGPLALTPAPHPLPNPYLRPEGRARLARLPRPSPHYFPPTSP